MEALRPSAATRTDDPPLPGLRPRRADCDLRCCLRSGLGLAARSDPAPVPELRPGAANLAVRAATPSSRCGERLKSESRPGWYRAAFRRKVLLVHSTSSGWATIVSRPPPSTSVSEITWERPVPFGSAELPEFPTEALPGPVRALVEAVAEALQVPVDLPAMLALGVLAAAAAKRVVVRPGPDWLEPVNLYTAVALPPGERKSATVAAMTSPLEEFEAAEAERLRGDVAAAAGAIEVARARLGHLQLAAAKAAGADRDEAERAAADAAVELERLPPAVLPRVICDDVTPEKLASLLAVHGGRMALISAEGGELFAMAGGRYSTGPNVGILLKGHAGDPLRVDRQGRPSEIVPSPALTIAVALQPDAVSALREHKVFRGRGLLGRFLWSMPRSRMGSRSVDPPPIPATARGAYHAAIRRVLGITSAQSSDGRPVPLELVLDAEGQAALRRFAGSIERRLGEFGSLGPIGDWSGKLVGQTVRIAGLLHVVDHPDAPAATPIRAATLARAEKIAQYLIPHATAAFAMMADDPAVEHARFVLRWLERTDLDRFTRRDLHRALPWRFPRAEDIDPVLALLVGRGYLRREEDDGERSRPGRPASPVYEVSPYAFVSRRDRRLDGAQAAGG